MTGAITCLSLFYTVGIAPGPIANTPGTTKLAPDKEAVAEMVSEGIPLGRMGEAWEIGQAVVYLCTANYVTGTVLVVDGGQWLYRPPMVPRDMVKELSRSVEQKSRSQAPPSSASLRRMEQTRAWAYWM